MRMFTPRKNSTLYVTLLAQQSVPALGVYVTPGTYWVEVGKMLLKLIPCCRLTNAEDGKPKSRDDQKQLKGAAFVGSFTSTLRLLFCRHLFFHKWNVWQRLMGARTDVGTPQWSNKNKEKPAVWCYRPYLLLATWQQRIAVRDGMTPNQSYRYRLFVPSPKPRPFLLLTIFPLCSGISLTRLFYGNYIGSTCDITATTINITFSSSIFVPLDAT